MQKKKQIYNSKTLICIKIFLNVADALKKEINKTSLNIFIIVRSC